MDNGAVFCQPFFLVLQDAVVMVPDDKVRITVVRIVPVGKLVVPPCHRIGADSVAGEDRVLHAVIIDKKMSLPFLDFMAGVIK